LITGSKGLIGKVLTESLSDDFDIYGLDIMDGKADKYHQADVSKYEELDSFFKKFTYMDCIVHLAADSSVNAPWESVLENNIIGTRNLYECAKNHSVKRVIFASSNHVTRGYIVDSQPVTKDNNMPIINVLDPIRPYIDYGSSKSFGEIVARQYFERYGIHSICLRIGWVIKDDNPNISELARNIWLSQRDLVQLIRKSLMSDIPFGIYYGVSNNKVKFWDVSNARKELEYKPKDDAYSITYKPVSHVSIKNKMTRRCRNLFFKKTIAHDVRHKKY